MLEAFLQSVAPFFKDNIRRRVQAFFDRFPDGKFENLKVVAVGDIGTFEWDFVRVKVADFRC